jgi:alkaline phosphatase D
VEKEHALGEKNVFDDFHVSRLDFLKYSFATSVAVWAGSVAPGGIGIDEAEARALFAVRRVNPKRFPQSVASGDPRPNGIVLWTRVAWNRPGTLRVAYEISPETDTRFRRPVLRGVAETNGARDFTVKVQLNRPQLKPFTRYRYRFIFNGQASRTGHFKTLPAAGADVSKVRFGYVSCQDYTNGYYNALYHLAREGELDFVAHLGDYMYETVSSESFQGGGPEERQFRFPDGGEECLTYRDYRTAYKKYKRDRNLQALHEKCAFIMIWDDHEFANDAYQVFAPDEGGTQAEPNKNAYRRQAATRAWAEFNPVGVPFDAARGPLDEIRLYRSFEFGGLMQLVMTDQRLYRDGPPAGNETQDRYVTPGTGAEEAAGRTMLGDGTPGVDDLPRPDQLGYFLDKMLNSTRTWKLWGNEVTFGQIKVANSFLGSGNVLPTIDPSTAPEGVYVTLDQWDGYQAERRGITRAIRDANAGQGVENFVTLTGDIHSYIAGYIKDDYDDPASTGENRPVGVELVCGSVTSSNLSEIASLGFGAAPAPDAGQFTAAVTASNPHIKYFNSNDHGYNVVEVTPASIICTMRRVTPKTTTPQNRGSGIREPQATNTQKETLRRFRINAGEVLILDETNGVPVPLAP